MSDTFITGSLLLLNWEEQFELGGQFLFAVESVRKVDPANSAVGVDGHPQRLDVVGAVGSAREVRQVELDLVPSCVIMKGYLRRASWAWCR